MQRMLIAMTAILLGGCGASLAQVSTMGTTAMGVPTTPGTIVTSPLNGPSPFSATTLPGMADTTLAPVPLASDPSTPATVVACSTPTGQIAPGTPTVTVTSLSSGTTPPNTMTTGTALGTISTPMVGSTTGAVSPLLPLGSPSTTVCSSIPGGPPTNGAALPLSTPEIPSSPAPGTIQPTVADLGGTSIDPTMTMAVMPTPNTSACAESVSMSLANPGMMAPANATGATATPGVAPAGC